MAEKLHFELVSPEKLLISRDVDMVVVPGIEGDFGVFIDHAPVVSTLRTGVLQIRHGDDADRILVHGGFAEVNAHGLTILVEEATFLAQIDRAALESQLKDANEDVADAKDEAHLATAIKQRDRLAETLAVLDSTAG